MFYGTGSDSHVHVILTRFIFFLVAAFLGWLPGAAAGSAAVEDLPLVTHRDNGAMLRKPHTRQVHLSTPAGTQSWTHNAFGGVKSWKLDGVTLFEATAIDLLGRPLEIEDASGTREIQYDNDKWTLNTVEWTDGPLEGFKLDEDADARGRLGTLTVSKNFDDLYSVTHTYRGDSDRIDTLTVTTTGAPAVAIDVNGPGGMADEFVYTVNGQNTHTYSRSRNAHGRLNGVSAPGFSQSWDLDAMGRVKDLTTNGKTTTHGYNPINGSLASAVSADESRHYTFNNRGELEEEVIGTETLAMLADLNQSGALTERENPRKLTLYGTFHTNAVTEILVDTNVVHTTSVTPFSYTFDETTLPALTDTNAVVTLDWSVVGTRPEEPGGTPYEGGNAVAEIAGEHLFAPKTESIIYDIATRRASDAFLNYGWDAANQPLMLEERHGPHRTEHDYDGSQRRVEKRVYHHGNLRRTHRFVYDGWLPVVEEVEDQWGNFAYRNLYVWGPGPGGARQPEIGATGQLALIIHQPKHGPPQLGAPIYNHRLDVVGLVDVESGQVVARYGYTPFGKTTYAIGPRADQNPFRFAGAYHDQETNTYYFGYRHYHPRTKQWISRDPIGEAGGLNLFAYANNDPVNGIDVLGLEVTSFGPMKIISPRTRYLTHPVGSLDAMGVVTKDHSLFLMNYPSSSALFRNAMEKSFGGAGNVSYLPFQGSLVRPNGNAVPVPYLMINSAEGSHGDALWALPWILPTHEFTPRVAAARAGSSATVVRGKNKIHTGYQVVGYEVFESQDDMLAAARENYRLAAGAPHFETLSKVLGMHAAQLRVSPAPPPASAGSGGNLIHLTDDIHASQINSSGVLRGNIYAGPASNAQLNGFNLSWRTGLSPGNYQAINIPPAGQYVFSRPTPIGPFTAWQRFTGQQYTARGVLDINTGMFIRQGVNWNQASWYATDAVIDSAVGIGIYLRSSDGDE